MRERLQISSAFVMLLAMTTLCSGCGAEREQVGEDTATVIEQETISEEMQSVSENAEESQSTESTSSADDLQQDNPDTETESFVSDRSAVFNLLSQMTIGWNLGNTFDAFGAGNTLDAETYWGNPKTTEEMIRTVHDQGFNTIRIPVTWAEHVGPAPDYRIDDAWINRVQEVVDYAYEDGMFVLLNTHHETEFWMNTDPAKEERVTAELTAIWTQIAGHFKDYNDHLIFEGMNENRIKGSADEWNGGTADERAVINRLNQAFIDAVRATGGKNETRCLVISTYGNNAGYTAVKELEIPQDDNIAVALHMYTPYVFTYEADSGNISTWDGEKKKEIVATMKQVEKYLLKNDVPVIVTEFGAVNKNNSKEVIKWAGDYLGTMNSFGVKCIWWDNGIYEGTGEKFGIFDRNNLTWYDPELADTLIAAVRTE